MTNAEKNIPEKEAVKVSGTALYRALKNAGANDELAKEAADDMDEIRAALTEVKISNRILVVLVLATFIKSFF